MVVGAAVVDVEAVTAEVVEAATVVVDAVDVVDALVFDDVLPPSPHAATPTSAATAMASREPRMSLF